MTGCLYISPRVPGASNSGVVPILFADTLVTWTAPHLIGARQILPANVTSSTAKSLSKVSLARKLHIVNSPKGTTAVAFAGEGAKIRECLSTLQWNIEEWENSDRPMRTFGDNVNLYGGAVEVIGVYVNRDSGAINTVSRDALASLPMFGMTASIGSGAADLSVLSAEFEPYLSSSKVGALIIRLSNAIIGNRVAQEILGLAEKSWGGFVEMVYLTGNPPRWDYGLKSIHLFVELEIRNKRVQSLRQIPRLVAYDPGNGVARILSMSLEPAASAVTFVLDDATNPLWHSANNWSGWRPRTASFTFIAKSEERSTIFTITVPTKEMSFLRFHANGDVISVSTKPGFIERLLKRGLRNGRVQDAT